MQENCSQTEKKPLVSLSVFKLFRNCWKPQEDVQKNSATLILNPLETSAGDIPTNEPHVFYIIAFINL